MTTTDYDFQVGAPVLAAEGKVGQLKYVVVDPDAEVVTHLVVERGLLTPEGIFLHLTIQEVSRQPRYQEERFVAPPPGWEPFPDYAATDMRIWGLPYGGVTPPIQPVVEYTIRQGIPERAIVLERSTEVRTRDEGVSQGHTVRRGYGCLCCCTLAHPFE